MLRLCNVFIVGSSTSSAMKRLGGGWGPGLCWGTSSLYLSASSMCLLGILSIRYLYTFVSSTREINKKENCNSVSAHLLLLWNKTSPLHGNFQKGNWDLKWREKRDEKKMLDHDTKSGLLQLHSASGCKAAERFNLIEKSKFYRTTKVQSSL